MKSSIVIQISLLVGLLVMVSCSNDKKEVLSDKGKQPAADTTFLADKNFVYKNLQSTLPVWGNHKFYNNKMYTDSTYKTSFVELTKDQKTRLIGPFIENGLHVKDHSFVRDLMTAYFISKQDKTNGFQPIIVTIFGDDYESMTLIVLDKNNSPVSGYNIAGGAEPGPVEIGDSLITMGTNSYSYLSGNSVKTYTIGETDYKDSTKKAIIIDSNVFVSTIDKTGKINTKQTVKVRFRKSK